MKKFQSDFIFDGFQFLPAGKVLLCDDAGTVLDIVSAEDAGDDVQVLKGTICPGWINAHCHTELSHLEGKIPAKKGLVNFVQEVMQQRALTEDRQISIKKGIEALQKNGVVAVGDICNTTDSIEAKKDSDIYFHNFMEVTGFVPDTALQRLEAAKKILHLFASELNPRYNSSSLAAHATYSVSDRLFSMINVATAGAITSLHNQETEEENKFFENKEGDFLQLYESLGIDIDFFEPSFQTSIQSVLGMYNAKQKLLLVHNTFTSEKDLIYIKKYAAQFLDSVHFVICPKANLYIENTLPNVDSWRAQGMNICVGTDSLASNDSLDILSEIATLWKANPAVTVSELLQWGTLNGATALGISDRFGSFEPGKRPGVNLIEGLTPTAISDNATTTKLL